MSLIIDGIDYEDLHARLRAAIDEQAADGDHYSLGSLPHGEPLYAADRRRIDRDLAGLREHWNVRGACHICEPTPYPCPDDTRYAEDMRDVADLYGVPHTLPEQCTDPCPADDPHSPSNCFRWHGER